MSASGAERHALYHHRTQGRDVEAVHIRGFCRGLEELGYAVEIVSPPGVHTDPNAVQSSPTLDGAKTSPLGWLARRAPQAFFEVMEIGYNLIAIPRLWKRCRELQPELICERYALYNASGVIVSRLTGIPIVLEVNDTAHVDRTRQGKSLAMPGLASWFERHIFQSASGLATVSGYLREQVVASGVPSERVRVTPNAVEADRFDPDRVSGAAVRARCGLEGTTVIGFAGSFAKWHGPDLLVRAFEVLARDYPELRLLLVGDGARRGVTEALVDELKIRDRVVFTGRIPHAEIPEHIAAMDIGVMPSSNVFGSPMKVFEYMAMGVPPVAPRYVPLEEAVRDGECGLLFTPEDLESLTQCMRTLVAAPQVRQRFGAEARRKVMTQHQWVHNAAAVADLARRGREVRKEAPTWIRRGA
jgi:glycosyltransferase involved in cell wall biosynthesis